MYIIKNRDNSIAMVSNVLDIYNRNKSIKRSIKALINLKFNQRGNGLLPKLNISSYGDLNQFQDAEISSEHKYYDAI